jgi:hypothetical protein
VTTVVNLYGGPGAGKSTSAAYLYYLLKRDGHNAELVREYVKDWAWDNRVPRDYDQLYLLGKQIRRESMLYGKVDYIVTDSPVLLGIYYSHVFSPPAIARGIEHASMAYYEQAESDGHRHVHVLLERSKQYSQAGRFQTEVEAREIDAGIRALLRDRLTGAEGYTGIATTQSDLDWLYRKVVGLP